MLRGQPGRLRIYRIERVANIMKIHYLEMALPPMEIPGQGRIAIFIQGGVLHALWQNSLI